MYVGCGMTPRRSGIKKEQDYVRDISAFVEVLPRNGTMVKSKILSLISSNYLHTEQ